MSRFLVVAWVAHPDFIPMEVGCVMPEPNLPFIKRVPPLFLRAYEAIHTKKDILSFQAIVTVLEYHNFTPLPNSDDDSVSSDSSSGIEGIMGWGAGGSLRPWPSVRHLIGDTSPLGTLWPVLPRHSGGAAWDGLQPSGVLMEEVGPTQPSCTTPSRMDHQRLSGLKTPGQTTSCA
jgi:hypothetical protein